MNSMSDSEMLTIKISCAVLGCNSSSKSKIGAELQFHCFPKQTDVTQQWLSSCIWKPNFNILSSQICSLHFEPEAYSEFKLFDSRGAYGCLLKSDAIPTVDLIKPDQVASIPKPDIIYQMIDVDSLKETRSDYTANEKLLMQRIKASKDSIRNFKDAIERTTKDYNDLTEEFKRKQTLGQTLTRKCLTVNEEMRVLRKVFSESQIKILKGKKMIHWSSDDMIIGYTIRHMSNKRCYAYLTKNLKIPLPALSSIRRWVTLKKEDDK